MWKNGEMRISGGSNMRKGPEVGKRLECLSHHMTGKQ